MQVYNEVNKELKSINFDIDQTIMMPITKGVKVEEYQESISTLTQRVKILGTKRNTILAELDLLFAEDETKYDRSLILWLNAINIAFEKVCYNFQNESLKPEIINSEIRFYQKYMMIYSKVAFTKGNHNILISDCGLFYAYTLSEIKKAIEERQIEIKSMKVKDWNRRNLADMKKLNDKTLERMAINEALEEDATKRKKDEDEKNEKVNGLGFTLLSKILPTDCFYTLLNNEFIKSDTTIKNFRKIFTKENVTTKIDWIGTLPELSRFIYLLNTDYKNDDHKAVCTATKRWSDITSKYFTVKGKAIEPQQIKNNNRNLPDKPRYQLILKAIKHLQAPPRTTQM